MLCNFCKLIILQLLFLKVIRRTAGTKAAVAAAGGSPPAHRVLEKINTFRKLNAFSYVAPEEILEEQIQQATEQAQDGPLKGQAVAVKDNFCVKGMPATCGSRMLNSFKAPYDATAVEKLISAGAIIVGKTNMDEFGMGYLKPNSRIFTNWYFLSYYNFWKFFLVTGQLTQFTVQRKIFGAFLPMAKISMCPVVAQAEVPWQWPQAFVMGKLFG